MQSLDKTAIEHVNGGTQPASSALTLYGATSKHQHSNITAVTITYSIIRDQVVIGAIADLVDRPHDSCATTNLLQAIQQTEVYGTDSSLVFATVSQGGPPKHAPSGRPITFR